MSRPSAEHKLLYVFLWLCLLATFVWASYVIFHEYRFSLNTDGAAADVLARLAIAEGRLVPQNWTYANGDLWILGPRLFLVVMLPWLGFGYLLHASATWLGYLYLLVMVYGTCRVLAPTRPRGAIIATVFAAGCFSTLNFEFSIGQGAYSLYAALALGMFGLVARQGDNVRLDRPSVATLLLVGTAAALVCTSNAVRGGVTIFAPLVAGWLAAVLVFSDRPWRERVLNLANATVASVITGAIVGTLLYKFWLLPSVVNSAGAAGIGLAPLGEMARRISLLPSAWFTYFRVAGTAWVWLSPLERVVQCLVWLISICFLVSPILVVTMPRRHSQPLVVFSWISLACYGATCAALVMGRNLFDGPASMRYATFAIYASACVLAIQLEDTLKKRSQIAAAFVILLCLTSVATIATWRDEWTTGGITYNQRMALIGSLEQRKISATLATYWNSEVLSVLSDGKLEALPVDVDGTYGLRRHAQNSPRVDTWAPTGTRQAIALTESEASSAVWSEIEGALGEPAQRYHSGPFEVWVYDKDIAKLFYGNEATVDAAVPPGQLMVGLSRSTLPDCKSEAPCTIAIVATNIGQHALTSGGTYPLRLGIQAINAQGNVVTHDAGRVDFPVPLHHGASERLEVHIPPSSNPEVAGYRLCLLQELVAWHCDRTEIGGDGVGTREILGTVAPPLEQQTPALDARRFHATLELQGRPLLNSNGADILVNVLVTNDGVGPFGSSTPPNGVNLGAHAIDESGKTVVNDLARAHLPQIAPGASARVTILLPIGQLLGYKAEILPVAEGLGWFDKWGTLPLIVGPFNHCKGMTSNMVCEATGKPLPSVPHS